MGSRSRPTKRGRRVNKPKPANPDGDFYGYALASIERALRGEHLTWNQRATIYTKLPSQLPRLCERHGVGGRTDGFIMVLQRLGNGKHLECFDKDILSHLIKLLREVSEARGGFMVPDRIAGALFQPKL